MRLAYFNWRFPPIKPEARVPIAGTQGEGMCAFCFGVRGWLRTLFGKSRWACGPRYTYGRHFVGSYLRDPLLQLKYGATTLDGAWSHEEPWKVIEENGDLVAAFGDLWKTNKDTTWSPMAAIHYAMVNQ